MGWFEEHDKLSGWFQGVVAVLALIGVFIAAQYQIRAESKRHQDDQRRATRDKFLVLAHSLAHVEAGFLIAIEELSLPVGKWKSVIEELDHAAEMVKVLLVQPFDLPHPDLVWRLNLIQYDLRFAKWMANKLATNEHSKNDDIHLQTFDRGREITHLLIAWCHKLAKELSTTAEIKEMERQEALLNKKMPNTP